MKWLILMIVFLFMLYLFMIAPRMSFRRRMRAYRGVMFAHRGYHDMDGGIPENSMTAFHRAITLGYGIELDVHLSADGRLIVFHDDTLKRMCGRNETVESLTSTELTHCHLSGTTETIPLLDDVLQLVHGQTPLLIELKIPSDSTEICEKLCHLLQNYEGSYLVQSFNTKGLQWFRKNAPHILRGQLSSRLTRSDRSPAWVLRFAVENLLCNVIGRPDFIAYKLNDLPNLSVWFLKIFFRTPVAVWTLRTSRALRVGKKDYDMQIFENRH